MSKIDYKGKNGQSVKALMQMQTAFRMLGMDVDIKVVYLVCNAIQEVEELGDEFSLRDAAKIKAGYEDFKRIAEI